MSATGLCCGCFDVAPVLPKVNFYMKKFLLAVGVLLLIGLALAAYSIGQYNGLVNRRAGVDAAWAQVQNVYQRRADLVPNLVATVKGAANFEQETLTAITEARASVGRVNLNASEAPRDAAQLQEFSRAQGQLGSALSRLLVVSENYPQLRATEGFQTLQTQLEGTENRITVERGRFNEVCLEYNAAIKRFPAVLLAGVMGFAAQPYFQADAAAQTVPKVQF
jgi:LemA protein